jgi:hypothetical protein
MDQTTFDIDKTNLHYDPNFDTQEFLNTFYDGDEFLNTFDDMIVDNRNIQYVCSEHSDDLNSLESFLHNIQDKKPTITCLKTSSTQPDEELHTPSKQTCDVPIEQLKLMLQTEFNHLVSRYLDVTTTMAAFLNRVKESRANHLHESMTTTYAAVRSTATLASNSIQGFDLVWSRRGKYEKSKEWDQLERWANRKEGQTGRKWHGHGHVKKA